MNILAISSFQSAMTQAGLYCPAIIADGKIHRFKQTGDKGKPCWYVIHVINDNLVYAAFGCWKRGINVTWCNRDNSTLSAQDRTLLRKTQEIFRVKQIINQENARSKVQYMWKNANHDASSHPYLRSKGIVSYGLRVYKSMLLIPLYNENSELESLQFITVSGDKGFKKHAVTKGCYFVIGKPDKAMYIAEGYATAATIHEATGCGVIVAFNAYNLLPVAEIIRKKYPTSEIVICADNDAYSREEVYA